MSESPDLSGMKTPIRDEAPPRIMDVMFNQPHMDHDPSRTEVCLPVSSSYPGWDASEEHKEQVLQRDEKLWNAEALARRKIQTTKIDKYILASFFPEEAEYGFVPYQNGGKCAFDLDLTRVVDKEAWDAAKATDLHHETPRDLPVAAWIADVDQPAFEIVELGDRIASEFKAVETAAYRQDTFEMQRIIERIKLQMRAVDRLIQVQGRAIESAKE